MVDIKAGDPYVPKDGMYLNAFEKYFKREIDHRQSPILKLGGTP